MMRRPVTCTSMLLGVHLMLGISLAIYGGSGLTWPTRLVFKGVTIGAFMSQAVLAGLWIGLSSLGVHRRVAIGSAAAALIWALAITAFDGWKNGGAMMAMLLWLIVPWAAVSATAIVLRRYRIHCLATKPGSVEEHGEGIQFSLRQFALIVAACAVLLSLVRGMKSSGAPLTIVSFLLTGGVFAIAFTVQTLACLWAALGLGSWKGRLWLPWSLAFVWSPLVAYAAGGLPAHYQLLGIVALACVSLVLETLFAVRLAGYRIVRDIAEPSRI